jgi:DNA polymerase
MNTMQLDIETFSDQELASCGVYRYASSPAFEILLITYRMNGTEYKTIDLARGEQSPEEFLRSLADPETLKWAHNASFERICLSVYLRRYYPEYFKGYGPEGEPTNDYLDPASWRCSMTWCAYLGLPLSLKGAGTALNLDEQKMTEGADLIRYFCRPCSPSQANGGRTRNLPSDAPEKWDTFVRYNIRDVEVEAGIMQKLHRFPVPNEIWKQYRQSEEINDRGIRLDMDVVRNALAFDEKSKGDITRKMQELTGLDNPNSVQQLAGWLRAHGMEVSTLGKAAVEQMIEVAPPDVKEVLELRQMAAKSSVKKYTAMQNAVCPDGRAHGMFQFYGANRSGRFSGRLIQLQNLPRNELEDLEDARNILKSGDYQLMDMLYDSVPDTLSQLVRTAFIPREGCRFLVADFSAIEARVIAYMAGEKWRMDAFAAGADIYCRSAEQMFHCKVEKHGVNRELRQKGKIAELALGYGGSTGALVAMGAVKMGIPKEELQPLVNAWRVASPNIVQMWYDVDRCAKQAIGQKITTVCHGLKFIYQSGLLFIELSSGRRLSYVRPRLGVNRYGSPSITYMGIDGKKKWSRIETFGGKLVENIVQGTARDILCYAMHTLSDCRIVAHVHDEVIIEAGPDLSLEDVCQRMSQTPPWMPGLVLRADGYETPFYCKK